VEVAMAKIRNKGRAVVVKAVVAKMIVVKVVVVKALCGLLRQRWWWWRCCVWCCVNFSAFQCRSYIFVQKKVGFQREKN
jgi:hypothetical protein